MQERVIAVDLGASSGRVMAGALQNGTIEYEEIHRFSNGGSMQNGMLLWDFDHLMKNIKHGISLSAQKYAIRSIGIDTWGVDFGMLDKNGKLLRNPMHYRDESTLGIPQRVFSIVSQEEIYQRTGIQFINFNTLYQLFRLAHDERELYEKTDKILMIPDLIAYELTGELRLERTIASTTNCLNAHTGEIDDELLEKLGIKNKFCPIIESGEEYGKVKPEVARELNIDQIPVVACCTHDTASAVMSMPSTDESCAYISSGTWSLLGTELKEPLTNEIASANNFTNEIGYNRSVRFLKNIMGLWILQNVKSTYAQRGIDVSFGQMMESARNCKWVNAYIDVDDQSFSPYGDMLQRVDDYLKKTNQQPLETDEEKIKCIYQSLAFKYRSRLEDLQTVTGKKFSTLYVFGGGSQATLLSQITADACGITVVCGPVEATAIGNIAVQEIKRGRLVSLKEARAKIANRSDIFEIKPSQSLDAEYAQYLSVTK